MHQSFLITAAVFIFVIIRFLMRELRERHLSRAQLFVLPGIVGAFAIGFVGWLAVRYPAHVPELGIESAVAIAAGIGIGFAVARFTTVRTETDGRIFFIGSYATVAIWVGALVLRVLARFALARSNAPIDSLVANAALVVLIASALTSVRFLVRSKAISEYRRGSTLTETAV